MAGNPNLRMKLLRAYFLKQDYAAAIAYGNGLEQDKDRDFRNATERVFFAWSLHYYGDSEEAKATFQQMDMPYSNYWHRLEYCKFLKLINRPEELNAKLIALITEFDYIKGPERKLYRKLMSDTR